MVAQQKRTKQQQQQPAQPAPPPVAPPAAPLPVVPGAAAVGPAAVLAGALTALFLGGLTGTALIIAARKALAVYGVSILIVAFLLAYAMSGFSPNESPFPAGSAEDEQSRLAAAYRAWYIVNAVRRLEMAEAKGREALSKAEGLEARYFHLHLRAVHNRIDAARQIDVASVRWGALLGWRAVMDARTTLECRAANGKNFRADREPVIGWPGAVHPDCRCIPVAPYPGARLLPSV